MEFYIRLPYWLNCMPPIDHLQRTVVTFEYRWRHMHAQDARRHYGPCKSLRYNVALDVQWVTAECVLYRKMWKGNGNICVVLWIARIARET